MHGKCLIILSYIASYTPEFITELASQAKYIICADGGQEIARKVGITPDCVIGDFDSSSSSEHFDCPYITFPAEKDFTDSEACIDYAVDRGFSDITLLGGIGGRIDHTIGNIAVLLKYDCDIEFRDMSNSMRLLRSGAIELAKSPLYKYFAVAPIDECASGITITGAKYPLSEVTLLRDRTLGISNEIVSDQATVSVERGPVLIMQSSDSLR